MRKSIAHFLLAITLMSFTPLREVLKVPNLIYHYVDHIKEDPSMGIFEFFDMHYNHGLVFDEDFAQDMQLPFKTMDQSNTFVCVLDETKMLDFGVGENAILGSSKINTNYVFIIKDAKLNGVFHPPKFS